jgi:hypothetical protein
MGFALVASPGAVIGRGRRVIPSLVVVAYSPHFLLLGWPYGQPPSSTL